MRFLPIIFPNKILVLYGSIFWSMKKILIGHMGALGDFILTWPSLKCLRKKHSNFHYLGLGKPTFMNLAIQMGLLDSFINMENRRFLKFFSGDSIPSEFNRLQAAILWLKEADKIMELLKAHAVYPVITINPTPDITFHVAKYYGKIIQSHFSLKLPEDLSTLFPVKHREKSLVIIHPGSGGCKKNYSVGFYMRIAEDLKIMDYNKICFLMGPVEIEQNLSSSFPNVFIEYSKNLDKLHKLLLSANFYIGNDSGVSHFAGILGVPTIALYKNTNPEIWGVIGQNVVNLKDTAANHLIEKIKQTIIRWKNNNIID